MTYMTYDEISKIFDKINDVLIGKLSDADLGAVYKIEAEALKSSTLYVDGEPIKTLVDEVFEPFRAFEAETERMFGR